MHLSCLSQFLASNSLVQELLIQHNVPISVQSSPFRRGERGIEGCTYTGYTCYWEIDFRHISFFIIYFNNLNYVIVRW